MSLFKEEFLTGRKVFAIFQKSFWILIFEQVNRMNNLTLI